MNVRHRSHPAPKHQRIVKFSTGRSLFVEHPNAVRESPKASTRYRLLYLRAQFYFALGSIQAESVAECLFVAVIPVATLFPRLRECGPETLRIKTAIRDIEPESKVFLPVKKRGYERIEKRELFFRRDILCCHQAGNHFIRSKVGTIQKR